MKNILLLLLLSNMVLLNFSSLGTPPFTVSSTDDEKSIVIASKSYYFSSTTGNDSYTAQQAQHAATPWKSIDKLNSMMPLFNGGDSILLKRGEVFHGTIIFNHSGGSGSSIVLSTYGKGEPPMLTGLTQIKKWIHLKGHVWQAICSKYDTVSNLFINSKQQPLGRFPNAETENHGYLTIERHTGKAEIVCNDNLEKDWTGAEIVIRDKRWILDRAMVTSQKERTLSISGTATYEPTNGFGFFIQNHISTLDQEGEWYFNKEKQLLYIYTQHDPNHENIEISVLPQLIKLNSGSSNLVIENILLTGAAKNAIQLDRVTNVTLRNLKISNTCLTAVYASTSRKLTLENSAIMNMNNDGINFNYCDEVLIKNNSIKNIGLRAGMGEGSHHHYTAMQLVGTGYQVVQNGMDSVGYLGIYFSCEKILIKNNFISNFCMVKDDGGGIYTFSSRKHVAHSQKIAQNIIVNGKGVAAGTPYYNPFACGIYLDDNSSDVDVTNNTILNCSHSGIYVRNSKNIKIRSNTVYNNPSQIRFAHDTTSHTFSNTNCEVHDNILVSTTRGQHGITVSTMDDYSNHKSLATHNSYYHPAGDSNCVVLEYYKKNIFTVDVLTLSAWKEKFLTDINSTSTALFPEPIQIDSLLGNNLIKHEGLKKIDKWTCWSPANNCKIEVDSTSGHQGVQLKLSFTSINGGVDTKLYAFAKSFSIERGKYYALYFSAKSSEPGVSLVVDLRKAKKPNDVLDEPAFFRLSTGVKNYEHIFKAHGDQPFTRLDFNVMEGTHSVWIGNVELREANIISSNTKQTQRFEFNAEMNMKMIRLDRRYRDASSLRLLKDVYIPPYSSAMLFNNNVTNVLLPLNLNIVKKASPLYKSISLYYSLSLLVALLVACYIRMPSRRKMIGMVAIVFFVLAITLVILDAVGPCKTKDNIRFETESLTIMQDVYSLQDLAHVNIDIHGYKGQQMPPDRSGNHASIGAENYITLKTKEGKHLTCQFQISYFTEIKKIKEIVSYWNRKGQDANVNITVDWI